MGTKRCDITSRFQRKVHTLNAKWFSPVFDSIGLIWVLGFVLMLTHHLRIGMDAPEETDIAITPQDLANGFRSGTEWHAIYLREAKVGFSKLERQKTEEGFLLKQMMRLNMTVMRQDQVLTVRVKTHLNPDYTLRSFDLKMDNAAAPFAAVGDVDGATVRVSLKMGDYEEQKTIQLDKPPVVELGIRPLLLQKELKKDERYAMKYFDPLSLTEKEMSIIYLGKSKMHSLGEEVEAHHLRRFIGEQYYDAWVNDLGEVLDERLPLGYVAIRESEAEATYGVMRYEGTVRHDVVEKSALYAKKVTGQRDDAKRALWKFSGVSPADFQMDGGRQTLRKTEVGYELVVNKMHPPGAIDDKTKALALGDESMLSIGHPKIQAVIAQVKAAQPQNVHLGAALVDWVFQNIQKKPVVSLPSAVQVLETREGDCNEHATLGVALLRGAGIPARMATGLAYLEGRYLFHAWVEYYDGTQWVSADPTWGQRYADVGHVRFLLGGLQTQLALLQVVGNLNLQELTWE